MRRPTPTEIAASLALLALGLLALPQPFHGDQALFTLSARQWHGGGALYADLWDLKPPAVHGFYRLAGALFGFTEIGVHALELLWQLTLAGLIYGVTRGWYARPIARAAAPLLSVGFYYAVAGTWGLTQVEGLAQLPLFVTLWASLTGRWALAGAAGAVCALFKTPLLLLVAAFWLVGLRRADRRPRAAMRLGVAFAAPLALVALWAASTGHGPLIAWTVFAFPLESAAGQTGDLHQLRSGLTWFARHFVGVGALATWATLRSPRDGWTTGLAAWAGVGLAVILVQTLSWWDYHYLLLCTPLGLLAARALDRWPPPVALAGAALALVPAGPEVLARMRRLARADSIAAYQANTYEGYALARREAATLRRPGPIYVYGNPLYLYLSGRDQTGPINGWSFDILLPAQWDQVLADVQRLRPAYVFVESSQWPLIRARHPRTAEALSRWPVVRETPAGLWLRPGGPPN